MPDFDKPENARHDGAVETGRPGDDVVLVYMTYPDLVAAASAGEALVEKRLAACVNIIPGMVSIYRWKGAIQRDPEVVMIVKTRRALAEPAMSAARELHPYDNPAMLVVPLIGGAQPFLEWVVGETAPSGPGGQPATRSAR